MKDSNSKPSLQNRLHQSVMLKLVIIGFLGLILLIPTSLIQEIINERQRLSDSAIAEVSSKWGDSQRISGPVLTVPFMVREKQLVQTSAPSLSGQGVISKQEYQWIEQKRYFQILPEMLNIQAGIQSQELSRGIYDIVVYESKLVINGEISLNHELEYDNVSEMLWDQAFLTVGISDLRGIQNEIAFKWGEEELPILPGTKINDIVQEGFTIKLPKLNPDSQKSFSFHFEVDLKGSKNLAFVPSGKHTKVRFQSDWKAPSFDGAFIPDSRTLDENGFEAEWEILQLNKNFPSTWVGSSYTSDFQESASGVDLLLPMDDYQKSMRSSKYAVMTIALTFLIFFLVEVLNGTRIHPIQYTLVGLGLCLFYVLLVSLSEHISFNFSYALAAAGIIAMISIYSLSLFKSPNISSLLLIALIGVYSFLFVTLQLVDYALLMGSFGLFVILLATMYFTRNIDWYNIKSGKNN